MLEILKAIAFIGEGFFEIAVNCGMTVGKTSGDAGSCGKREKFACRDKMAISHQ